MIKEEKIAKLITYLGLGSRRESDAMVRDGRVTVNGVRIADPLYKVNIKEDHIKVDEKRIDTDIPMSYMILNKPKNVLSTKKSDETDDRSTILEMLRRKKHSGRVLPVGRLDYEDEGVVLLTSDPEMISIFSKPDVGIPRVYLVKVRGIPDEKDLLKLKSGMAVDGGKSKPIYPVIVSVTEQNAWLKIVISDPKSQILKKSFLRLRHDVLKIKRLQYGPLSVSGLAPGTFRKLTEEEVAELKKLVENPPKINTTYEELENNFLVQVKQNTIKKKRTKKILSKDSTNEQENLPRKKTSSTRDAISMLKKSSFKQKK